MSPEKNLKDTQWPRYYVFEQPRENAPYIHAGSVHASDSEMALLIARDIFGRRPERTTMWVVRDNKILSRTQEQIKSRRNEVLPAALDQDATIIFHVFGKLQQSGVCMQLGQVKAVQNESALALALEKFSDRSVLMWWVFAEKDVTRPEKSDQPALFDSSPGKPYRHERDYPVRTMMMELRSQNRKK